MTDDSAPTTAPSRLSRVERMLGVNRGQVAGEDTSPEPKPWDGPDEEPISGAEGVMPSTFEADTASTDHDTVSGERTDYRYEQPLPVRLEQASDWRVTPYSLAANVSTKVLDTNPRRIRAEIYVKSADVAYLGPNQATGTYGFPSEEGYPFLTTVTGEVWAQTGVAQTVYVLEEFRSQLVSLDG